MGALMRQYWVPAALSSELPARDGAPVRIRLLGVDPAIERAGLVGVLCSRLNVAAIRNNFV